MGYVTLEDYDGEIEAVVFPSAWETERPKLIEDTAVSVSGRIQSNEQNVKILAERVIPLGEYPSDDRPLYREIHLYVDVRHETDAVSAGLGRILRRYHGDTPVFLHLESSRQEITMTRNFWLDFSRECEEALKGLLGPNAVEGRN